MKTQTGFTLVELLMVMVLLGILSAIAIGKFLDVRDEARLAAVESMAGRLGEAMTSNYAVRSGFSTKGSAVANCTDGSSLLVTGLPSGYVITAAAITGTADCTLTYTQDGVATTATFKGIEID